MWFCLVWLRSRFVLFRCFSAGETEIWPGDLRFVAVAVCSLFICVSMMCLGCKAKEFIFFARFFTASLTVRTGLRARSAATEGKKNTANANTEKASHAMLRKSATTPKKQHRALTKTGAMEAEKKTLQSATVFPGIMLFHYTRKSITFW